MRKIFLFAFTLAFSLPVSASTEAWDIVETNIAKYGVSGSPLKCELYAKRLTMSNYCRSGMQEYSVSGNRVYDCDGEVVEPFKPYVVACMSLTDGSHSKQSHCKYAQLASVSDTLLRDRRLDQMAQKAKSSGLCSEVTILPYRQK